MNAAFADTLYWQALFHPGDSWHLSALRAAERLGTPRIVTTEEVFSEFRASMGKLGPHFRSIAVAFVEDAFVNPEISVIRQSHESFLAGLSLYKN
jgi:uncharacterized protein